MKVLNITVDEIPKSCGECGFMKYINDWAKCCAFPDEVNDIAGNPYDMNYRRSDCPLSESEKQDV